MNLGDTNTKSLRGGIDSQGFWDVRIRIIGRDCRPVAQVCDANGRPCFAVFSPAAHSV